MSEGLGRFKPYTEYKDSDVEWLGKIPKHWKIKPLKKLLLRNDSGVWGDDAGEDGTIVLRSTDQTVDGKWMIDNPSRRLLSPREFASARLERGDLVATKSSGSSLHIGKTSIVDESVATLNCCFSNFMQRLRISPPNNPRFYWHLLNCPTGREQLVVMSSTTTGLGNLNGSILGLALVPEVPFEEQSLITEFLDRETDKIDALIAKKERLIELLQEKRSTLITHAVTKGLDSRVLNKGSRAEWFGQIPAHWDVERNRYLFREAQDRSSQGEEELLTVSHITGVTRRSDKNVNMIEAESHEGYKICAAGDLAINTMWAWMGALGIASENGMVSPSYNVYRIICAQLSPRYYDYLCRIPNHVAEIVRHSKGIWKSRLRLYPESFKDIFTPVPPISEQRRITAFLDKEVGKIDGLIYEVYDAIDRLAEYRTAMICAAVTGKIDVRTEAVQAV